MGKRNALKKSGSRERRGARRITVFSRSQGRFSLGSWQTLALILGGGSILHASVLTDPFLADDYLFLDHVRSRSLVHTVLSPDPLGNFFRPVGRQVYFWLNAHISNESPAFFHFVNLCLFLIALGLLFFIAKRLAGQLAATVAAGFFALHYAIDIPIRWASGSQDLLALVGAFTTLQLVSMGRKWLASPTLFLSLLCKETVVFTPLVAILIEHSQRKPWKEAAHRAWPLFLAVIPWAVLWLSFGSRHVTAGLDLDFSLLGFGAALVQLVRVACGLEWPTGQFGSQWFVFPPIFALLPIVTALLLTRRSYTGSGSSPILGLGWALLGALPVAPVAVIWSAYYYVFALAGVSLALGTWATRLSRWAIVILILVVAWTSQAARHLNEFASKPSAWSGQSHISDWYFERAATVIKLYLRDLKEARPTVPHASTFYFFSVPSFTAWQTADGPLVRWAYRDSSLRSYWLSDFSLEKARRGPLFFFQGQPDRLVETLKGSGALIEVAIVMLSHDNLNGARNALLLEMESKPTSQIAAYCLGWVEWAIGDTTSAIRLLRQAGVTPSPGPTPELSRAVANAQSAGTRQALLLVADDAVSRHALDPLAQGLLADLYSANEDCVLPMFIAAFAARALDPQNPQVWRRWGMLQYEWGFYAPAKASLERYFALGGVSAIGDKQAREALEKIPSLLPGGDQVQRALRRDPLKTNW